MSSQTLREARKMEEIMGKQISAGERPLFHLTPRAGWMNDPNGFCYHAGQYHMFYQYNPYSSHWDSMHWGHAVSSDLLHWEYLPAALAPDEIYDSNGCFSGSAVTLDDGRMLLMYTGVPKEPAATIFATRRSSGERTGPGQLLWEAVPRTEADRFWFIPAKTASTGYMKENWQKIKTASARCGNAPISLSWTERPFF